jgi:hypothetical protein
MLPDAAMTGGVMEVGVDRPQSETAPAAGWAGRTLMVGGVVSLFAAGLLLWSERGAAVFNDTVLAALAWCF